MNKYQDFIRKTLKGNLEESQRTGNSDITVGEGMKESLNEVGTRQGDSIGEIKIGKAFQAKVDHSSNGKATVIVRDIQIRYGLGDPDVTIYYDYKIGDKKGSEKNLLKKFLETFDLGV